MESEGSLAEKNIGIESVGKNSADWPKSMLAWLMLISGTCGRRLVYLKALACRIAGFGSNGMREAHGKCIGADEIVLC
jgi:hypothetical protein